MIILIMTGAHIMWSMLTKNITQAVIRMQKKRKEIRISDTTLRDGEQMPGVRLTPEAKVKIAKALARAGIHSIDAGFPAAAPDEVYAMQRIVKEVKGPIIMAHCRTLRSDIDHAVEALDQGWRHRRGVQLFIGISPQHREHKHRKSKSEIIKITVDAIDYAKRYFGIISFGPEDASRTEPDFLHEIYREAIDAGVTAVGFADTVGILTPEKAADTIKRIQDCVPNIDNVMLGVHFHNDLGLATANALASIAAGANIVQGTITGIGERAGNTAIEEVVIALQLHKDQYGMKCTVDPTQLAGLGLMVSELTGVETPPNKPVIGSNIFMTESGVHQDGLLKDMSTYLPFLPEEVGAGAVELVLGKHSGRKAVKHRCKELGIDLTEEEVNQVVKYLKEGKGNRLHRTDQDLKGLLTEIFGKSNDATLDEDVAGSGSSLA
jgi:2-isopropylmalate synthase